MTGKSTSGSAFLFLLFVAAGGGGALAQTVNQLPAKWKATLDGCGSTLVLIGPTCPALYQQAKPVYDAACSALGRTLDGPNCGVGEPQGPNNATYSAPGNTSGFAGQVVSFCSDAFNDRGSVGAAGLIFCPVHPFSRLVNAGTTRYCGKDGCQQGNPVHPATGNKFQVESDYRGHGAFPLEFVRYYNSMLPKDPSAGLGVNWTHTYSRKLVFDPAAATPPLVSAVRHDGKEIPFMHSGGGVYMTSANFNEKLARRTDVTPNRWELTAPDDQVEVYGISSGKLESISNRVGLKHQLAYETSGSFRLLSVSDDFGRSVTFAYQGGGNQLRIQSVTAAGTTYSYTYDAPGNLKTVTSPHAQGNVTRTYLYGSGGQANHLTGITDEDNRPFATYAYTSYEGFQLVSSSENGNGANKLTIAYNTFGTAPRNPAVTRHVDLLKSSSRVYIFESILGTTRNREVAAGDGSCPGCGPRFATYDTAGNVATRTDWNNIKTCYTHDGRGLELTRVEGLPAAASCTGTLTAPQRKISSQWHADYRLPAGLAEPLRITTMTYGGPADPNPGNRGSLLTRTIQATTDATGALGFGATASGSPRTWTYTYNANGSVLTVDGPRTDVSDVTTYTYYPNNATCPGANAVGCRGQVETITNAAGHVTQIGEYNAHGQPLSITDPNGFATTLAYDQRQRLTSRSVGGETTTYTYDNAGLLTRVTLPDGSFLAYAYDNAHRLTQISDNLGNRITYTLDLAGNRTQEQVVDPVNQLAQTRSRVYNNLNRLTQEIGATGQTTAFGYDNQGNVTSIDGPLAGTVDQAIHTYDALSRLTRVTDPNSGQVNYGYNGLDHLTSVKDPRNLETTYSYDGLSNLNQQVSPDTGATVNTYDLAGNLLTQTDAKGQVTTYVYDALNRVTGITYQGGVVHSYAYDQGSNGKGRLTQIVEPNSTTNYVYDQKGRLTSETRIINAVSYVTAYAYDSAGRMTGITYPSGREVSYTLDSLGRIQQVATTKGGVTQAVVSSVAYRPFGPAQSFSFGNGQTYTRGFDQDGRIASYTLATQSIAVGYDPASRISFLSDTGVPANTNNYGYDNLDRLTSFTGPSLNQAFSYDGVGNRLTKTVGANTDTYAYGTTSNRLATIAGANNRTYAYDNNGSTTGDSVNTYAYDTRGRMVQATSSVGATDYKVNSLGQRIRKTNSQGDTIYHYDAQGKLIAESNAAGAVQKEYVYLGDTPVAVLQ